MSDKLMTFDEYRTSHLEALRRQREHLRSDAVADQILNGEISWVQWVPWDDAAELS